MRRFRILVIGFTLAVTLGITARAGAEPIQITSGFLGVGGVQDVMSRGFLRSVSYDFATAGFRMRGVETDGPTQRVLNPLLPRAGEWMPDGESWSGILVDLGLFTVDATPSFGPAPFSLIGRLRFIDMMETRELLFDQTVFGHGTATWTYLTDPWGARILSGVRYDFSDAAPTPEPATLLLLGSGVAALAVRRRRRRAPLT